MAGGPLAAAMVGALASEELLARGSGTLASVQSASVASVGLAPRALASVAENNVVTGGVQVPAASKASTGKAADSAAALEENVTTVGKHAAAMELDIISGKDDLGTIAGEHAEAVAYFGGEEAKGMCRRLGNQSGKLRPDLRERRQQLLRRRGNRSCSLRMDPRCRLVSRGCRRWTDLRQRSQHRFRRRGNRSCSVRMDPRCRLVSRGCRLWTDLRQRSQQRLRRRGNRSGRLWTGWRQWSRQIADVAAPCAALLRACSPFATAVADAPRVAAMVGGPRAAAMVGALASEELELPCLAMAGGPRAAAMVGAPASEELLAGGSGTLASVQSALAAARCKSRALSLSEWIEKRNALVMLSQSCDVPANTATTTTMDIHTPDESYDKAINIIATSSRLLEANCRRAELLSRDSGSLRESKALRNEFVRVQEQQKHQVFERLSRDKATWFPKPGGSAMAALVAHIIYPRVMSSHADALFCARFVRLLTQLRVPSFQLIDYYNQWTSLLTQYLRSCTEREAQILGVSLRYTMQYVLQLRSSESFLQAEMKDNCVPHREHVVTETVAWCTMESIPEAHSRWEYRIFRGVRAGLDSPEWIEKRNVLVMLSHCGEGPANTATTTTMATTIAH